MLYGNGNILGYTRVGDQMIVDEKQAKAVKRIFQLYLQGNGVRKIQYIMEQEGYLTATGLSKWQAGNVSRVLKNPFYCGRIEYRKQYVPDYLTQKKINNRGEVEKIYVQGTHEILISPEDFDKVQQIFNARVNKTEHRNYGKSQSNNVWVKKLRCTCNHSMNCRPAYVAKNGDKSYVYQCYNQMRTGTKKTRMKKGLSLDNICENSKIPSTVIDQYVEQIIYDKGVFTWILNPSLGNECQRLEMDTSEWKKAI